MGRIITSLVARRHQCGRHTCPGRPAGDRCVASDRPPLRVPSSRSTPGRIARAPATRAVERAPLVGSRILVSSGIPGYPPGYQIRALILSLFRARARLCAIQRATLWSCLTLRKKPRTPKHFRARERPRHPPSPAIFIVATPARIYVVSTNPTPPPNHRFDDDGDVFDADRRAHYDALACGAVQFSERV